MSVRPMFPPTFDSTMIGTLRSCPRKLQLAYVEHWKPGKGRDGSIHLTAGKAFASGVEAARRAFYEEGHGPDESLDAGLLALTRAYPPDWQDPEDEVKSFPRMAGALEFYFSEFPLGQDRALPIKYAGRSGVEFSFAHPLDIRHPVSGNPILYTGRADMVATAFGGTFIFDEKTTQRLGPTWLKQWDLRSQFTGYCWALREYGFKPTGVVVRGMGILPTQYSCLQAITYRAEWEIDRWYGQVLRDIRRAIQMWEEGYWDYNLDHACTEYSGCQFGTVCKSPEPDRWLNMYFEKRVWDPMAHTERTPAEWEAMWK